MAKLAGIPQSVLNIAKKRLAELENQAVKQTNKDKVAEDDNLQQFDLFNSPVNDKVIEYIDKLDLNNTTPMQALQHLEQLKQLT